MLLVEISIGGTTHRVSNKDHELTNLWKSEISSFRDMRFQMESKTGGFVRPDYGDVSFLPSLFTDDWPPPVSCAITVKYTETTEAAATTLFTGTAHIKEVTRRAVTYRLYGPEYTTSVDGQAFNDTLVNVASWCCDSSRLNLTLDSTKARSTSPNVTHTTNDVILLDELSKICAFYSHYFYISGSTLYLVDTLFEDAATETTEFHIFPSEYPYPPPYSKVKSGDYSVDGSHSYGGEISFTPYHTTQANIETALADLKTLSEYPEAVLHMPICNAPSVGDYVTLTDESCEGNIVSTVLIQGLVFDFDSDRVTATGLVTTNIWDDSETWTDADTWAD